MTAGHSAATHTVEESTAAVQRSTTSASQSSALQVGRAATPPGSTDVHCPEHNAHSEFHNSRSWRLHKPTTLAPTQHPSTTHQDRHESLAMVALPAIVKPAAVRLLSSAPSSIFWSISTYATMLQGPPDQDADRTAQLTLQLAAAPECPGAELGPGYIGHLPSHSCISRPRLAGAQYLCPCRALPPSPLPQTHDVVQDIEAP